MNYVLLLIGGGLGTIARYLISQGMQPEQGGFPWGTLCVNLAGCLLIGIISGIWSQHPVATSWRLFLAIGMLGGFTTFSTFALDSLQLWTAGHFSLLLTYLFASNVGGIIFAAAGYYGFRSLF